MIIPKITRTTILYRKLQAEKDQDESGKKKEARGAKPKNTLLSTKEKKNNQDTIS